MDNKKLDTTNLLEKAQAKEESLKEKKDTVFDLIKRLEPQIKTALPSQIQGDRFIRILMTTLRMNPDLMKCGVNSLMGALLTASQLGLEPGVLNQCFLIPYYNKSDNVTYCEFQLGYKGMLDLIRRSGNINMIYAQCVYEHDVFKCEFGLNPSLIHRPNIHKTKASRGEMIAVYGVVKLKNGGDYFEVFSKEDIEKRKAISKSAHSKYSPWAQWPEEMAKKTVIRYMFNYLPMSTAVSHYISNDFAIKKAVHKDMTFINEKDELNINLNK